MGIASMMHLVLILSLVIVIEASLVLDDLVRDDLVLGDLVPGDLVPGEYSVLLEKDAVQAVTSLLQEGKVSANIPVGEKRLLTLSNVSTEEASLLMGSHLVVKFSQSRLVSLDPREKPTAVASLQDPEEKEDKQMTSHMTSQMACQTQRDPIGPSNIWHLARLSNVIPYQEEYRYTQGWSDLSDIYVIDTGVDIRHPDFGGRAINAYIASNLVGYEGYEDYNGHGTLVGSLAAGKVYGSGKYMGVYNIKVFGRHGFGTTAAVNEGIAWASDHGARQARGSHINLSLGGRVRDEVQEELINTATARGIAVVTSAGGSNDDASRYFPAGYDRTIVVGATDKSDRMALSSNWGPKVDTLAPGVDVWGAGAITSPACAHVLNPANCHVMQSGTSLSCPLVVGLMGRVTRPSPESLRTWLHITARLEGVVRFNPGQESTPNRLVHFSPAMSGCPT